MGDSIYRIDIYPKPLKIITFKIIFSLKENHNRKIYMFVEELDTSIANNFLSQISIVRIGMYLYQDKCDRSTI